MNGAYYEEIVKYVKKSVFDMNPQLLQSIQSAIMHALMNSRVLYS